MEYTLDELVGAVASRLQAAGLDRQANGQVSAFPDRRTLRYYTTIGLMDRPVAVRDRQAIYGDRHATQAVAVKRLQASGLALAAIQDQLTGLPFPQVEAIASGQAPDRSAEGRRRFWAETPAAATAVPAPAPLPPPPSGASARAATGASSAWGVEGGSRRGIAPFPGEAERLLPSPDGGAQPMLAVPLASGATLLLSVDQPLSAADIAGIRSAARDLLTYLDHLPSAAQTGVDVDRKEQR